MITKEQITEILNNHAGYIDRSRTEQAVHEDNFNDVADEILSKLSQHDVIKNEVAVCENECGGVAKYCEKCYEIESQFRQCY